MEREYKKCHERNNLPYPQGRVDAAKAAIKQAVADVIFKGEFPGQHAELINNVKRSDMHVELKNKIYAVMRDKVDNVQGRPKKPTFFYAHNFMFYS